MTTVDHYKPNLRDTFFQLFEVLEIQKTSLGKGRFASMDEDTARASLEGFLEVMQSSWAPSFAEGDRIGATFDGKGNVTLPPGYKKALDAYFNGVNLPGILVLPPDSPEYVPSTATANLVFRPNAVSMLDQAIALLNPLAALPGNPGGKAAERQVTTVPVQPDLAITLWAHDHASRNKHV